MKRMKLRFVVLAVLAVLIGAGVAYSTTTGTVSTCATVPAQTISANGTKVGTIPAATNCATTTYTVPTVTQTTTNTVTTTVTTTVAGSAYLFNDEFDGTSGAAPDPSKWVNVDGIAYGGMSCNKANNAYLDGSGHLVLRMTREAAGWCSQDTAPYAGAGIGTYQYQTGWPPLNIKSSWPVPFAYEVRFKCAAVSGGLNAPGWLQNVDRNTTQPIFELDNGETRTTDPLTIGFNQHEWLNGSDIGAENASASTTDCTQNWHTVRVEATSGGTYYYLDGTLEATHAPVTGTFGVQLHANIPDAGTWWADNSQPAAGDPGPWTMLVDYVRVTGL